MRFFVFVFNSMCVHLCIIIKSSLKKFVINVSPKLKLSFPYRSIKFKLRPDHEFFQRMKINHQIQKRPMNLFDSNILRGVKQSLGLFLLCMVVMINTADGQSARLWEKTYGANKTEEIQAIVTKPNGDYVFAGFAETNQSWQVYIIRTDVDGDLIYEKDFGGNRTERAYDMTATSDGVVVTGDKTEAFGQPLDILVMKISDEGDLIWEKTYGGSGVDQGQAIINTPDGGFLIAGESESYGNGDNDMFLLKLDTNGDSLWLRTFDNIGKNDGAEDVVLKEDGSGYVVMGSSGNVSANLFLVETDLGGNEINRSVLDRPQNFEPKAIVASDDSYLVAGGFFDNGIRAIITRFDLNLNEIANRFYGNGIEQGFNDIIKTDSGDFVAAGYILETAESIKAYMVLVDENLVLKEEQIIGDNRNVRQIFGIAQETNFRGGYGFAGRIGDVDITSFVSNVLFVRTDNSLYIPQKFIEGNVFVDNGNCQLDLGEKPLSDWIVTLQGANEFLYASTNEEGHYFFRVDEGEYTLNLKVDNETWVPCFNDRTFDITGTLDSFSVDFPVEAAHECAYMEIDISAPELVICEATDYKVQYCNKGTVDAENVIVEVELDELLEFNSASTTPSRTGNLLTFDIGQVDAGDCGEIIINTTLDCTEPVLGQTHTLTAKITPDSICVPASAAWDGSSLKVDAVCENDSVKFLVTNTTNVDVQGRQTLVIEDEIFMRPVPVDVGAGETTPIAVEGTGATWRIIVPQDENHPGKSNPTIAIEGCDDSGNIVTGHVTRYEEDEKNPFVAVEPIENEENSNTDYSFLRGYPKGVHDSLVTSQTDLEYHFRFQNTGNDTLRRAVVRDTISSNLDITSVRFGASSHPYTIRVYETGVVKFIFDDINLPPAAFNPSASKGFVKFKISQKPNNPAGTVINNGVALSMDFEEVRFSNQTKHVIGGTQLTDFITVYTDLGEIFYPNVEVNVFPNPFFEEATIEVKGPSFKKYEFEVYDVSGRTVITNTQSQNRFIIKRNNLPKGLYFYRVTGDDHLLNTGKIAVH